MPMKLITSTLVAFLSLELLSIVTIHVSFCHGSSNHLGCVESEREALLRFKQDLIDPSNRLASWSTVNADCCTWSGVVCDNRTGHVLELNLRNYAWLAMSRSKILVAEREAPAKSMLKGKLNPSLLNLKHLMYLDLSCNDFEGVQIPEFFGQMRNLRYLNLSRGGFQGRIPHQLGNLTNLEYLDLRFPSFSITDTGNLDELTYGLAYVENLQWLSGLSTLKYLDLAYVDLSKASDWLHVVNTISSLNVLNLIDCGLYHFPSQPITNLSSLAILHLSENYFEGPIPDALQNLTALRHLYLSFNFFSSSLPDWWYKLHLLEKLYLPFNSLQGSLGPLGNLTSIKELYLHYNRFEGGIPVSFKRLCNLRSFYIPEVELNQEISTVLNIFSGCVSDVLEDLEMTRCKLFGHLTNQIGLFKSLKNLLLSYNSISGPVPSALGKLGCLQSLDFSYNMFTGTVSDIHFANLTRLLRFGASGNSPILKFSPHWVSPLKLQNLTLSSCHLGSQFPSWIRSLKHLSYLDISNSSIFDSFPTYLFTYPSSIVYLDLSHNGIYGLIPNLIELDKLEFLDLSSNNLSGPLPLIPLNLYMLDLSKNSFSGSIFHFLCHEINASKSLIQILILKKNLFYGNLPDCWANFPYLTILNLNENNFSGNIPISFGSLSSLQYLHLRKNNFFGNIPMSLRNCTELLTLDLGENSFVGNVPTWLGVSFPQMVILNLRSNKFQGRLPRELCHFALLQILDIADNNFHGTVPRCINNFSAITNLWEESSNLRYGETNEFFQGYIEDALLVNKGQMVQYNTILQWVRIMDLSKNNFSGEIPVEVTDLVALQVLNLSHNHFTGTIPKNIGVMRSLECIDLSGNQLFGEIPQSISNLTFLSYLNFSNNKLIGKIPLSTQIQGFDASCFTGNNLCGPPLSKNCGVIVTPSHYNEGNNGNEHEVDWFYVSMALGFMVGFWAIISPLLASSRWRFLYYNFLDSLWIRFGILVRKICGLFSF
ncbi:receptor-like protein EIX2 [Mangifera indica]|uniref:receptor-like protein EIX2 n=1 Tax=Mangifera indica TaxID=29780 RepID=UPI001CF930F5|nr:receptor-like protein EIX2 [Mangifera indica]